jgi:sterol desaturase/sphingolipid hydroxylase (fatty acid hydroxylase superfamily)
MVGFIAILACLLAHKAHEGHKLVKKHFKWFDKKFEGMWHGPHHEQDDEVE